MRLATVSHSGAAKVVAAVNDMHLLDLRAARTTILSLAGL